MKKVVRILAFGLLFTSCNSESTEEVSQHEDKAPEKIENCIYTYNPAKTDLEWTAYKFLRKAGVGGTFKTINVKGDLSGADAAAIIKSLSFSIPIETTETNNPDRNKKIQEFFFGNLASTELIKGKVVALGENGTATLEITMNEIAQEVEGKYTLEDNVFTYQTEIDVNNWNAEAGLSALNDACKDLHTDIENGDTESKLWPDVTISFKTELTKTCD